MQTQITGHSRALFATPPFIVRASKRMNAWEAIYMETQQHAIQINAGDLEHLGAMAAGAACFAVGISHRKSPAGLAFTLLGAALVLRGAQGYKRIYKVIGRELPGKPVSIAKRSPVIEESIVIDRSPAEIYGFWRKLSNLPAVMAHLLSVQETSLARSHWVAKAPAGTVVEWDAEIVKDESNQLIAWRSLEGSDVDNAGRVVFEAQPGGGTRVSIKLRYAPPADVLGAKVARLIGADPAKEVAEDLKRLKHRMEVRVES